MVAEDKRFEGRASTRTGPRRFSPGA